MGHLFFGAVDLTSGQHQSHDFSDFMDNQHVIFRDVSTDTWTALSTSIYDNLNSAPYILSGDVHSATTMKIMESKVLYSSAGYKCALHVSGQLLPESGGLHSATTIKSMESGVLFKCWLQV